MKFLPAIIWAIVILIICMLPQSSLPQNHWFNRVPEFDKLVHFGVYVILFGCLRYALPEKLWSLILICTVYGILIELLQKYFTTDRSAEVLDAVADACGATFGAAVTLYVRKRRRMRTTE